MFLYTILAEYGQYDEAWSKIEWAGTSPSEGYRLYRKLCKTVYNLRSWHSAGHDDLVCVTFSVWKDGEVIKEVHSYD